METMLGAFYGAFDLVLSPSSASDQRLGAMGIERGRIARRGRGVDVSRFAPGFRVEGALPGEVTVLYAGRLTEGKGMDLLADAFLAARRQEPRLHLVLAAAVAPGRGAVRSEPHNDDWRGPALRVARVSRRRRPQMAERGLREAA